MSPRALAGDEFAVLLPTVDKGMAQKAKERILKGVEKYNNENPDAVPLSLSIGFATADKEWVAGRSLQAGG